MACSAACAEALGKGDRAVDLTLRKSVQMARASAYGCYFLGLIFIAFAFYSHRVYPAMRVAPPLMAIMGFAMIVWGVWYHRVASKT
jgi:hypothetical protein